MSTFTPAAAIRAARARSFVRISDLPGSAAARRKAASRAVVDGDLVKIRRGLYYRGVVTVYGMTTPSAGEVLREALGTRGVGLSGHSAAREWGVTTQVPPVVYVATLKTVEGLPGVKQSVRSNLARADLNAKEIALLELLREPESYVEAGWAVFVAKVGAAIDEKEVRLTTLEPVVAVEHAIATRANFARLLVDLGTWHSEQDLAE
jgi:hypothetical protein